TTANCYSTGSRPRAHSPVGLSRDSITRPGSRREEPMASAPTRQPRSLFTTPWAVSQSRFSPTNSGDEAGFEAESGRRRPGLGSGDWVEDPETGYLSDYDLLAVVESEKLAKDLVLWNELEARARAVAGKIPVTLIVHDLRFLNHEIRV